MLTTPDGKVPANLSSVRDGLRTADDRPLAGVMLGAPRWAHWPGDYGRPGAARPLSAGCHSDSDGCNGFYQFIGLSAGNYAVYEVHPSTTRTASTTPGTTGGLAFNGDSPELDAIAASLAKHPARAMRLCGSRSPRVRPRTKTTSVKS